MSGRTNRFGLVLMEVKERHPILDFLGEGVVGGRGRERQEVGQKGVRVREPGIVIAKLRL